MSQQPSLATPTSEWVKIATVDVLKAPRPVAPVTFQGQKLVLFRDEEGELGLIGRYCPHRGADLCFGRHENNGIRCPFHGWHFDRSGQCTEQPAEPEDSTMYKAIKLPSFTVVEHRGDILAWAGEGTPPALAD
ncbi:Rieske 2Fe-2S domain-containing protein [Oceanicola sp. S124]|uniref:Rieske 2Fe-2S domain-containing protein n=1 Tax=Oceanicola sp. S124 TaxID=1042378 RepID=UPI0002559055|nr:Rieske 2Fe-2S domain-containing protein [Oceanicola sp. S124]